MNLSVIIPVYNQEKILEKTLDSLVKQSILKNKDRRLRLCGYRYQGA